MKRINNIKNVFTTRHLEDISGIKAHTIRTWEKRYSLFKPKRASRNIRYYNLESLQKLLNIVILLQKGFKISKIAAMSEEELIATTKNFIDCKIDIEYACNTIKMAMYSFNAQLFEETYQQFITDRSFSEVYQEIFAPFLHFVGLLWQTNSITPAHEHFISNLIYQKIQLQLAQLEKETTPPSKGPTFVLLLPEEEMHEISLLYLNYELRLKGYQTVYLGRTIPLDNLNHLTSLFPSICIVSIFTIAPSAKALLPYLKEVKDFLGTSPHQYWAIGRNLTTLSEGNLSSNIHLFSSVSDALQNVSRNIMFY